MAETLRIEYDDGTVDEVVLGEQGIATWTSGPQPHKLGDLIDITAKFKEFSNFLKAIGAVRAIIGEPTPPPSS